MTETTRLEDIFRTWDKNQDGCLDRNEFAGLIKAVNPEAALTEAQLGLILEEVWTSFPRHINTKGLTLGGLKQLYAEGIADLEHDYQMLKSATALVAETETVERSGNSGKASKAAAVAVAAAVTGTTCAATALAASNPSAHHVERVEVGCVQQAAPRHREPKLVDIQPKGAATAAALSPISPAVMVKQEPLSPSVDMFAGLQTPQNGLTVNTPGSAALPRSGATPQTREEQATDVFAAIKTPAPPAALSSATRGSSGSRMRSVPRYEQPVIKTPGLAFCVVLEDLTSVTELKSSLKDRELLACLRQALPEGSSSKITYVLPTALGLAVGVACRLPEGSIASEDVQYTATVLQHEPDQIFPSAAFGHAEVVMAAPHAVDGDTEEAAKAAASTSAALAAAGVVGKIPVAITVRVPAVFSEEEFMGAPAAAFMTALEKALPVGTSARITSSSPLPNSQGLSVSIALAVPSHQQAQATYRQLRDSLQSTVPGLPAGCAVIASAPPGQSRPSLAVKLMLPGVKELDFWGGPEMDVVDAIEEALPDGCTAAVSHCTETKDGLEVTAVVALSLGCSVKETQRCAARLQQAQRWGANLVLPGKKVQCIAAGDALEIGLSPEAQAIAASIDAVRQPVNAAVLDSPRKSPGLFNRMFSRKDSSKSVPNSPEKVVVPAAAAGAASPRKDKKSTAKANSRAPAVLLPMAEDQMSATGGNTPAKTLPDTPESYRNYDGASTNGNHTAAAALATAVGGLSLVEERGENEVISQQHDHSLNGKLVNNTTIPALMAEDLHMSPVRSEKMGVGKESSAAVAAAAGVAPTVVSVHAFTAITDADDVAALPPRHRSGNNNPSKSPSYGNLGATGAGASPSYRQQKPGTGGGGAAAAGGTTPPRQAQQQQQQQQRSGAVGGGTSNTDNGSKKKGEASPSRGLFSAFKRSPSSKAVAAAAAAGAGDAKPQKGGVKKPVNLGNLQLPSDEDLLDQVARTPTHQLTIPRRPEDFGPPSHSSNDDNADSRVQFLVAEMERILHDPTCGTNDVVFLQDAVSRIRSSTARHEAHMEIGERLSQRKLYPEALRSFKEATAANASDPLAHFRLANTHFAMRQYGDASKEYTTALACCKPGVDDPLFTKILVNHGITQESIGSLTVAVQLYERAVSTSPEHPRAYKLLGSARYALGEFEGAKIALRQAIRIKAEFPEAYGDLGCTYIALGDVDSANRCLRQAIKLKPDLVEAHFNLGNLLRQCHDFEKAVESYDTVLSLDPAHWRSLLNRAVVLICLGDNDRAAADLQRACRLSGHLSAGSLASEVEQLRRMLRSNADWTSVSQMMSYIEDRARQIDTGAAGASPHAMSFSNISGSQSASMANNHNQGYQVHSNGIAESLLRRLPNHQEYFNDGPGSRGSPSVRSFGGRSMRSVRSGGGYSTRSGAPSVRQGFSPGRVSSKRPSGPPLSPNRSPEKLRNWEPPAYVAASDIGAEVATRLAALSITDVPKLLETLDVPLLQQLQPCSCVSLAEVWLEVQESPEILSRSRSRKGAKMVRTANAELVLRRLLAKAPASLFQHTMRALQGQVLALLDHQQTGYVDLTMLLCLVASLSDSSIRDRMDLMYKMLMWRNSNSTEDENPITRKDLVELMATLKMVYERSHKTNYLMDRKTSAIDSQYIIFGRFQSDLLKFFPHYEALPMLCNPLS